MPKVPSPWRIIDPVRPQIRRAMAIATAAAVLSTAALLLMAHMLKELLAGRADWWLAALLLVLTLAAFAVRGYAILPLFAWKPCCAASLPNASRKSRSVSCTTGARRR